jgi:peptidoglycan hydrolase-like protein with peptidoglycan-binding domain
VKDLLAEGSPESSDESDQLIEAQPELDPTAELLAAMRASQKRRWVAPLVGFGLGCAIGAVAWASWTANGDNADSATTLAVDLTTVAVETRDLATYIDFDGSLGFGDALSVTSTMSGTLTAVPDAGAELLRGDVLYEVNAEPVVLLYGAMPSWRDLDTAADPGRDVEQLEANLWALGYTVDLDDGNGPYLTVDDVYDWATAYAVEQWEDDLGLQSPDGTFEVERAVYGPGQIRVDSPSVAGALIQTTTNVLTGTVILEVSDIIDTDAALVSGQDERPTERVTLAVSTDSQDDFSLGEIVEIELSDGRQGLGTVADIDEVAEQVGVGNTAQFLVDVTVEIIEIPQGGLLEGPVTVRLVDESAAAVRAIPVRALVALSEGGYAVQLRDSSGISLIGVETGLFADGWVEVVGDISEGDEVVVPS